jgi:hypothetical protein
MESDRDPDAFAKFYRRHAGRLLSHFAERTRNPRLAAELLAETFAAALADPERLDTIAEAELAHAERAGQARDRARKRLGIPELAPGDRFLDDLEEELVAAARFRATRHKPLPRPRLPRPPARLVRGVLAGALALAAIAAAVALALGGGDDPPRRAATSGPSTELVPMVSPPRCIARAYDKRPASPAIPYFSVFNRPQRIDDRLAGDLWESLPIASYDPRETRLAANGRRGTRLHAIPSLGVSAEGGCAAGDGPGVCLLQDDAGRHRCFTIAAIRDGLAFARTERGSIVGIAADGVGRVTLTAGGRRASATVSGNVYEAELDVAPGTRVGVQLARVDEPGCEREVAPGLLDRVAALRRAPGEGLVPMAALSLLRDDPGIAEPVERGARFWGAAGGVDFWAIPVATADSGQCGPATAVCIVAVTTGDRVDAECGLDRPRGRAAWRLAPLLRDHAVIYGTVPDGVTGARVTLDTLAGEIRARDNVLAAVLPFPYDAGAEVELLRSPLRVTPRVGIVDAGGDAAALRDRIAAAGFEPKGAIVPGVKRQPRTTVHWRPRQATLAEAAAVARAAGASELTRIGNRTPLPVIEAAAPIVVVSGTG